MNRGEARRLLHFKCDAAGIARRRRVTAYPPPCPLLSPLVPLNLRAPIFQIRVMYAIKMLILINIYNSGRLRDISIFDGYRGIFA